MPPKAGDGRARPSGLFRSLLCCSLGERYPLWACFTTLQGGDEESVK